MFGKCKVCAERLARIDDLKLEISHLRKLVLPSSNSSRLPVVQLEADKVLSASDEVTYVPTAEAQAIEEEANSLLNASY